LAGSKSGFGRRNLAIWALCAFYSRNRHWQSPGRYLKKLPNSPARKERFDHDFSTESLICHGRYANTDAVLQGFANRECEVVTASVDAITLSPARTSFCCQNNLVSIGLLVSIPVAFPASPEVVNALSYWITQVREPAPPLASVLGKTTSQQQFHVPVK
jgi:hypothetical protein